MAAWCAPHRCRERVARTGQGAYMARRWDGMAGRLLLGFAVVLHRTVASRAAAEKLQQRRNAALRAANRRGVPVEELAARLGLSAGWVRQVLNGRKPPEVEEAA